jgi:hypothetical protein
VKGVSWHRLAVGLPFLGAGQVSVREVTYLQKIFTFKMIRVY